MAPSFKNRAQRSAHPWSGSPLPSEPESLRPRAAIVAPSHTPCHARQGCQAAPRRRGWAPWLGALTLLSAGCSQRPSSPTVTSATPLGAPAPSATLTPPRSLAHPYAFALTSTEAPPGAALVWAPAAAPGRLELALLSPLGAQRAPSSLVSESPDPVLEVVTRGHAEALVVAWLARQGSSALARAAVGSLEARHFAPTLELGAGALRAVTGQGSLALAIDERDGDSAAMVRLGRSACASEPGPCERVEQVFFTASGVVRRAPALAVPEACPAAIGGLELLDGRMHYAVCSGLGGRPQWTVFSVQPEPMYAVAHPRLSGCHPLGSLSLGHDAVFVAQCAEQRQTMLVSAADRPPFVTELRPTLRCAGGKPVIEAAPGGALSVPLERPQPSLELLLPASIAPPRSRAAWTGERLLVATPQAGALGLRRYRCSAGRFQDADAQ